jgi:acyl carrier protein
MTFNTNKIVIIMDMNKKTYEDIYSRTYSRIYNIVIEVFEVSEIPQPVLDFVIFKTEYNYILELSNGGDEDDALNFLYQIEQEFDIEIPYDEGSKKNSYI